MPPPTFAPPSRAQRSPCLMEKGFSGDLKSKPFSARVRVTRTSSRLSSPTITKRVEPLLTEPLGRVRHCASWQAHAPMHSVLGGRDPCPLCSWGHGHTDVQASDRWRSQDLNSGIQIGAPALFSTRIPPALPTLPRSACHLSHGDPQLLKVPVCPLLGASAAWEHPLTPLTLTGCHPAQVLSQSGPRFKGKVGLTAGGASS